MKSLRTTLLLLASPLLVGALTAQQDVYWQASRISQELHRINACGEVELTVDLSANNFPSTTAPSLRSAHLAPDGQVWVVNFIVPHFTVLNGDGTNIRNITTNGGGRPYSMVFDGKGLTYITMTGTPSVEVYDAQGTFVKEYPLVGGNPLGITIDANGMVWVAHRQTAPSKITKIDPGAGTMTDYPFPGATSTLGGQITADYQGLLQGSTLWCIGDRSSELVNFDTNGNHLGTYVIDPNSSTISAMTIDSKNNVWIGNFRGPDIYYFDTTQKKVVTTIQSQPNTLGLAIDSRGRLLATARVSFSGPQPSVVRRFNTTTYVVEHEAEVGLGAGSAASSGFHRALVVDPLGDADGDGFPNFSEVTQLSAPYDNQSTPDVNVVVAGANEQGGAIDVQVLGKAGSMAVLGIATKRAAAPICNPAWKGCLRVDPATLTPFFFSFTVPNGLKFNVPNDPTLVGFVAYFQALYADGVNPPTWSNIDCVNVYK